MRGFRYRCRHLYEMFVKINGETHNLWRAVDQEGEVLDSYVSKKRDMKAALRSMKKALKNHGSAEAISTGGLLFFKAARRELGNRDRLENSCLPLRRRERLMQRFRRIKSPQKFVSVRANVRNHFNLDHHFTARQTDRTTRCAALAEC